jgi:hypothetical protein
MPKYTDRKVVLNDDDSYKDWFDKRGIQNIDQYASFFFNREYFKGAFATKEHIWTKGDRLFKLANIYYDSIEYWWIIALWNDKPTDAHYNYGDVIEIPYPPMEIYRELVG